MEGLLEPSELLRRMEIWAKEETAAKRLPKGSWPILRMAVLDGEFARGDAADITGYATRQARTDLTGLFWTKLCEKLSLERSFGHAEEEV